MKSIYVWLLAIISAAPLYCQSNVWNASGNIGIGTTTPQLKLEIAVPAGGADGIQITRPSSPTWQLMNYGPFYIQESGLGPRLVVAPGGNVGIGTTGPNSLLEIHRAFGGNFLILSDDFLGGGAYTINPCITGVNNAGFELRDLKNSIDRLVIDPAGNVGIGTTNPISRFHVVSGANHAVATYTAIAASGISDFNVGGEGIQFSRPQDGAFAHAIYTYDSAGGAKNNLALSSRSDIVFTAGNGGPNGAPERMRIAETGNVGIGTINPTQKLSVNGTVRAKEVIVETTGWSDDVFSQEYKLETLSNLETEIKQQKHLPGIPSAEQVAEKGIAVGEMQAKLLAKVEELTLYAIRQEKRIEQLEEEVRRLNK